jgi:hypothetical protein
MSNGWSVEEEKAFIDKLGIHSARGKQVSRHSLLKGYCEVMHKRDYAGYADKAAKRNIIEYAEKALRRLSNA